MLSFPITKSSSPVLEEEEALPSCFLLINKEAETLSSLNQTRRTFESSPDIEQREAMKLDLLSLWGCPVLVTEQSHAADAGLGSDVWVMLPVGS